MGRSDLKVRELVDKVVRGDLALPEMQRRYVWPQTRVRDLLDSLYRGYPSGTILVWEPDEEIENIRRASVQTDGVSSTRHKQLLLDGQQRLTSLAAVIRGQPIVARTSKKRQKMIEILFNLDHPEGPPTEVDEEKEDETNGEEENGTNAIDIQEQLMKKTFVVGSRSLKNNPKWISVSDIFIKTDKQLLAPIGINSDSPEWDRYSNRLADVRKIQDYTYSVFSLEKNLSYPEVTEIFVRVNSKGAILKGSDLALAQITSKWKGFMKEFEDFVEEFGHDEEYILEKGLLVRMLMVMATNQSKFDRVGKLSREKLGEAWIHAKDGLKFSIDFLRNNAKIANLKDISSPYLLVPIALYWKKKESKGITPTEEKALLRWFYIAHMRGHYSHGSSETILDQDLSTLKRNNSPHDLLETLIKQVKKTEIDEDDISGKNPQSPFFSMLYFILKQQGAKDWVTGLNLSDTYTDKNRKIQFHHIFPQSLLRERNVEKNKINDIANLAFIGGKTNRQISNKEPKNYIPNFIISNYGEEPLTSQLIPMEQNLWELENYETFINTRRKLLVKTINDFMKKLEN